MLEFPTRKNLHLENFEYKGHGHVYHITICTADSQPYFRNARVAKMIADELDLRSYEEIRIYCYCIMPDHLHLLMSMQERYGKSLQNWVAAFKRYTSRVMNMMYAVSPLWQRNFHDHVVRREESLLKIAEYIIENPVRKGLVADWKEYPFSRMNAEHF